MFTLGFIQLSKDFTIPLTPIVFPQETVHEKSQKYKEGKIVLERYLPFLLPPSLSTFSYTFSSPSVLLMYFFLLIYITEEGLLMKLISPLNSILTPMPA